MLYLPPIPASTPEPIPLLTTSQADRQELLHLTLPQGKKVHWLFYTYFGILGFIYLKKVKLIFVEIYIYKRFIKILSSPTARQIDKNYSSYFNLRGMYTQLRKFWHDSQNICTIKAFQMMKFERRDDSKLQLYIGFYLIAPHYYKKNTNYT